MKKIVLVMVVFSLVTITLNAQIIVNASDYDVFFNSGSTQKTDTAPTILPGSAGANMIFDFSTLNAHVTKTNNFMSPASGVKGSSFPMTDICMLQDTMYHYYDTSATQIDYWGFAGNLLDLGTNEAVVFTDPEKQIEFPASYNANFTDAASYDSYFEYNALYDGIWVDSIRQKSTITTSSSIDAWGTITTPNATLPCLRQNVQKHFVDTTWAKIFVGGYHYWIELYTDTGNIQSYSYLSNVGGGLIATIEYYEDSNAIAEVRWNPLTLPAITVSSQNNVSCNAGNDGSASISVSGGSTPYTYLWSNAQTTATTSGLSANTYSVTVTDAVNSTATATITITEPTVLTASATTLLNVSCYGGNNGSAKVTAGGGTTGYTYLWSNGQTTVTATGLTAQGYSVTVTDNEGCTQTANATISEPSLLTASISAQTNVSCFGGNNGSATVLAAGGTTNYTYLWSNGQTTSTASGLTATGYSVTVTDANGCFKTAGTTLTQPTDLSAAITALTNETCSGCQDGSATVTATGATTPYTYLWSNSQTAATATGLAGGNYSVTVTDNNLCTEVVTLSIASSIVLTADNYYSLFNSGNVMHTDTVPTATEGSAGTDVTWNFTSLLSHLTDTNNYMAPASGLLGSSYPMTNICLKQDSDYHYYDSSATSLEYWGSAGNHLNISSSQAVVYDNPETVITLPSTYNVNFSDISSFDNTFEYNGMYQGVWVDSIREKVITTTNSIIDGWGTIITPNATMPCLRQNILKHTTDSVWAKIFVGGYHYWIELYNDTTNTQYYSYLSDAGGGLIATVEYYADSNKIFQIMWNGITLPVITVSGQTNVSCNGGNDGTATTSITGGTSPFTYEWSNGQSSAIATGLAAGTYTVTVTDAMNSKQSTSVTITEPTALTASIAATADVSCKTGNDGMATVNAGGGTTDYTYTWSTTPAQTTATATGLAANSYTVTVTDANSCAATATAVIGEPSLLIATISAQTNSNCGASDGTADVTASGGTTSYTYSWGTTPDQTTSSATGLAAGSYTVTVTDNKGCTATATASISNNSAATVTIASQTEVSCNGGANGSATATATGGTGTLTYVWSTTPVQNTLAATGLSAGTYAISVTDTVGCLTIQSVTIGQPAILTAQATSTDITCNGDNDGTATVTAAGGITGYTYTWSTSPVQTASTATGLLPQSYSVTVTDANSCTATATVTISEPAALGASISSSVNVSCNGDNDGEATASGTGGTTAYSFAWNTTPAQTTATATGLSPQSYTVTITDANGCISTTTAIITEPSAMAASITTQTNAKCNGGNDGAAAVSASGGTTGYSYTWNTTPPQTTSTATGLSAGSYIVTVTDANGCTKTATATISAPTAVTASITSQTNLDCYGDNDGIATVSATGGTSSFSFAWSTTPAQTTATATGLVAGNYTVTVTDANSCVKTATVTMTEPTLLAATISSQTNLDCYGDNDGNATVTASGGTTGYTYSWSTTPAQTTATATGLVAGNYTVTVTDANSCVNTASVTITEPALLAATISAQTNLDCNGANDGDATVSASGGTTGYSYAWSTTPTQTAATATGLVAGTYTVTVTDANNCSATASADVLEPPVFTAAISAQTNTSCNGDNDGDATVTANGGTSGYTYNWSTTPAQTGATATGLGAGSYDVTVTDTKGCTQTASVTITEPAVLTASITSQTNVICNGGSSGQATVSAAGGTSGYNFNWNTSPSQTAATATDLVAGTFNVIVTDANGCTANASVTITEPTSLTTSITSTPDDGTGNGTATVVATGGTSAYSYEWSTIPLQTTGTASGLDSGTYYVTVTDANGCTATNSVVVIQVSIGENGISTNILTYPNPSTGEFILEVNAINNENYQVLVRDINGRIVLDQMSSGENRMQINLNNRNNGIYFLQVVTNNGIANIPITIMR